METKKESKKPKKVKKNPETLLDPPVYVAGDAEIWDEQEQVTAFENPGALCSAFTYCDINALAPGHTIYWKVGSTWYDTQWVGKTTNSPPGR